jgi:hypothetical protein
MPQNPSLFRNTFREAATDFVVLVRENVAAAMLAFIVALAGIPGYLLFTGVSTDTLRDQLAQVAAYSLMGPLIIAAFAYIYFCIRAPRRLYAKRVSELRELRIKLGQPTDDLDEPLIDRSKIRAFIGRYGSTFAIIVLLGISGWLYYLLGMISRAYLVSYYSNKVFVGEYKIMFILNEAIAEDAMKVCDEQKLRTERCESIRKYTAALRKAYKPIKLPTGNVKVVPAPERAWIKDPHLKL